MEWLFLIGLHESPGLISAIEYLFFGFVQVFLMQKRLTNKFVIIKYGPQINVRAQDIVPFPVYGLIKLTNKHQAFWNGTLSLMKMDFFSRKYQKFGAASRTICY